VAVGEIEMAKSHKQNESTQPSSTPSYADVGLAYTTLRPVLMKALAHLARQGFAARPEEAMDLIHDFFVSEYPGLVQRFNARLSAFQTYAVRAFVFFSRRRIVKMQQWRSTLVDVHELSHLLIAPPAQPYSEIDFRALADALNLLPAQQRDILRCYLSLDSPSERKVATEMNLTRYTVRESIAEALAQIAIRLGERGPIDSDDWPVAVSLWRDRRSIQRTAQHLHQAVPQVHAARQRILNLLAGALARIWRG
jgi:RNA polymerase sigma factor (sigma-70 family)